MEKYILAKEEEQHSLFKNSAFHFNKHNEHAIYIHTTNELNGIISGDSNINNDLFYLKTSYDYDRDFKVKENDNSRFDLFTQTCFFSTANDDVLSYSPIYKTTAAHLLHGYNYTIEELSFFEDEQLKELILFSNIDQYNLICSAKSIHNDFVNKALSLRYVLFLMEERSDIELSSFCNTFHPDFYSAQRFETLLSLKNILDESVFDSEFSEDLFLLKLPKLKTPPTHEWLLAYYDKLDDYQDECFLFDFADYKDSPYSSVRLLAANNKLSEEETETLFQGLKTHILFTIESHISMYKKEQNISDNELEYLLFFLDWLYLFDFDKSIVSTVFEVALTHNDYQLSSLWERVASKEELDSFDFKSGDLFDEWLINLTFSNSPHINTEENIQYLIDNYSDYLSSRKAPSKDSVVKHVLDNEHVYINKFFFKKSQRLGNEISSYKNSLSLIKQLI